LSNFLAVAFDSVRRSALDAARLALPQRCELCAGHSGTDLVCRACTRGLPRIEAACPVCALPAPGGATCGRCLAHPPPFDATTSAYAYEFPVDRLVQAFKYHGRLALAEWCAETIVTARMRVSAPVPAHIVAMPLAAERQRERGFNQAVEIARAVATRMGATLIDTGVRRTRATAPQAASPWEERTTNIRGAFACSIDLAGMNIAVVDDVMTTGATLAEFARTLKAAGAARVENLVVARTPPPNSR
jgi:ComF family protein